MKGLQFHTPIVLIIFNRPDKTRRVFEEIRNVRPTQLFIIADGPSTEEDQILCEETRLATEKVDWPCEVKRQYAEKNMGVKHRPTSGISWVFSQVERAIILEDDCLPQKDFFYFCEELLERYKNDKRIMHISGNNFQQKNKDFRPVASYYFSAIPHIWGWATWKRAWNLYDINIRQWLEPKIQQVLKKTVGDPAAFDRWNHLFAQYYDQTVEGWDGQWVFCCLVHQGLSVTPTVNLVSNIGQDNSGTHSKKNAHQDFGNIQTQSLSFPLTHPKKIQVDTGADMYTQRHVFEVNLYWGQRVRWFFKSKFPKGYTFLKEKVKNNSSENRAA